MPFASRPDRASSQPVHLPVMLREVIKWLDLSPGMTVVDGTVGAGGHSQHLLEAIGPEGYLIGTDRDPMMLEHARQLLPGKNVYLHQGSYALLPQFLAAQNQAKADRVLLDLGLSSDQLADDARGFSFHASGPLDLRFDISSGKPAHEMLTEWSFEELKNILETWGEEKFSRQIATAIIARQQQRPIRTASELVETIVAAIPGKFAKNSRKHPATRVFQALRIAVNEELAQLDTMLSQVLPESLAAGGRVVIITFHSLEDRMVKLAFKNRDIWENLTPRPVEPTRTEQKVNPRSRSAKIRVARRL